MPGRPDCGRFQEPIMTDTLKVGDKVEWHSSQGPVRGTIRH